MSVSRRCHSGYGNRNWPTTLRVRSCDPRAFRPVRTFRTATAAASGTGAAHSPRPLLENPHVRIPAPRCRRQALYVRVVRRRHLHACVCLFVRRSPGARADDRADQARPASDRYAVQSAERLRVLAVLRRDGAARRLSRRSLCAPAHHLARHRAVEHRDRAVRAQPALRAHVRRAHGRRRRRSRAVARRLFDARRLLSEGEARPRDRRVFARLVHRQPRPRSSSSARRSNSACCAY
ncbi:hypothetical protein FEP23_01651 [Burkholderia multivorans]|nr:hypothetical protein [Burkholderia multivorans]